MARNMVRLRNLTEIERYLLTLHIFQVGAHLCGGAVGQSPCELRREHGKQCSQIVYHRHRAITIIVFILCRRGCASTGFP